MKRSEVWNFFVRKKETKRAKCLFCEQHISIANGSMGNLRRHLNTRHKGALTLPKANQNAVEIAPTEDVKPTIVIIQDEVRVSNENTDASDEGETSESHMTDSHTESLVTSKEIVPTAMIDYIASSSASNQEAIDSQIFKMVVKEYLPFDLVEKEEFIEFLRLLRPSYKPPSRKTLENKHLDLVYNETVEMLREEFRESVAVSLTTDCWTSYDSESFIAVTGHFINSGSTLTSYFIGHVRYNSNDTTENISAFLRDLVTEWNLTEKIICVVTDNTPIVVAAVKENGWKHLPCFGRTLNIIVQLGLEEIKGTIDKVKVTVDYFQRSVMAQHKLKNLQAELGLPDLKLKRDVPTRWNSTFDMMTRFLKNKASVSSTLDILQSISPLTSEEWDILEHAVKLLIVFNSVTVELRSEKFVSLSKVPVLIKAISKNLDKNLRDGSLPGDVRRMGEKLLNEVKERFKDLAADEIVLQSVFLDPRFKKNGITENIYPSFLASFQSHVATVKAKTPSEEPQAMEENVSTEGMQTQSEYVIDLWMDVRQSTEHSDDSITKAKLEIENYLQDRYLLPNEKPLPYWGLNKIRLPALYAIALERLCLPATSVPGEQIFTKAGNLLREKRNLLQSSKLSKILFLNSNLQ